MPRVHQLIYVSAAKEPFSAEQLEALLASARANNEANDVTGILLYEEGSFLQLLEGDERQVRATFRRIEADPRHHRVMVVHDGKRSERSFPEWSMGYPRLAGVGGARPAGYNDFFSGLKQETKALDTSVAAQILDSFRQGRWHMYVGDPGGAGR